MKSFDGVYKVKKGSKGSVIEWVEVGVWGLVWGCIVALVVINLF